MAWYVFIVKGVALDWMGGVRMYLSVCVWLALVTRSLDGSCADRSGV